MTTQQHTQVKPGDYFYTSWGYDQTNIDYLVVVKVSLTGKTATCQMVSPINTGSSGVYDALTLGTAYGQPFKMQIKQRGDSVALRGSYPYISPDNPYLRLDTFLPARLGDTHWQTMPQFGH